jgi:hypothetical protein
MPSTIHESNAVDIENNLESDKKSLELSLQTQLERSILGWCNHFAIIPKVEINRDAKVDYFVPSALAVLDRIPSSQEKLNLLQNLGLENILLQLKPGEKLSEFNTRILERLVARQHAIEQRKLEIQNILLEQYHIVHLEDAHIKSLINSSNFVLNYLEVQNIKARNNFSILELATGEMGDRGYGQNEQLYVPLVCEVLVRSGFAVDGIDRYQDISDQNLDFGRVANVDLTGFDWEKSIKHKYDMVIFLRNWHSEVFLHKYRERSKVVIFENDFLVDDFQRDLLPKVYDILETNGVFFTTFPFKKKDLFDVEAVFARFNLHIFCNLDGLILARKKSLGAGEVS